MIPIQDIYQFVADQKVTYVDFSKDVAKIMGVTWSTSFKDRVYQCIAPKGNGVASDDMYEAMAFWCEVMADKGTNFSKLYTLHKNSDKLGYIGEILMGKRQASPSTKKKMFIFMKSLQ